MHLELRSVDPGLSLTNSFNPDVSTKNSVDPSLKNVYKHFKIVYKDLFINTFGIIINIFGPGSTEFFLGYIKIDRP